MLNNTELCFNTWHGFHPNSISLTTLVNFIKISAIRKLTTLTYNTYDTKYNTVCGCVRVAFGLCPLVQCLYVVVLCH